MVASRLGENLLEMTSFDFFIAGFTLLSSTCCESENVKCEWKCQWRPQVQTINKTKSVLERFVYLGALVTSNKQEAKWEILEL